MKAQRNLREERNLDKKLNYREERNSDEERELEEEQDPDEERELGEERGPNKEVEAQKNARWEAKEKGIKHKPLMGQQLIVQQQIETVKACSLCKTQAATDHLVQHLTNMLDHPDQLLGSAAVDEFLRGINIKLLCHSHS